jgi:hypothetical protein
MLRTRHLVFAPLLAAATLPAADDGTWDYWIRVEPQVTFATISGDAKLSDGGLDGTTFSTSDVGLDSREATPGIEIGIGVPLFDFGAHLGYQSFSTSGSGDLTQSIAFGGITFPAGTAVDSEAEITDLYAELYWAPIALDLAGFSLGIAAHQLQISTSLEGSVGTETVKETLDESAIIPTLVLRGYVSPLDMLEAEVAVQGMTIPGGDVQGTYLDIQAKLAFYPIEYVGIIAGYRHTLYDIDVKSDGKEFATSLTLSGPFVGIAAQF